MKKKKFLGITGKPGSGKTVAAKILEGHGFTIVSMGDIVRKQVEIAGLPPLAAQEQAVFRTGGGFDVHDRGAFPLCHRICPVL